MTTALAMTTATAAVPLRPPHPRRPPLAPSSSARARARGRDVSMRVSKKEDDEPNLNTGILYERMKAMRAQEAATAAAAEVEDEADTAAIERDQAIVAGIRGDAAERAPPSGEAI